VPGLVNVDFADVRAIMANAGSSLMGIGTATGKQQTLKHNEPKRMMTMFTDVY
jgi:cell division GTPase FtsZ